MNFFFSVRQDGESAPSFSVVFKVYIEYLESTTEKRNDLPFFT